MICHVIDQVNKIVIDEIMLNELNSKSWIKLEFNHMQNSHVRKSHK